MIIQIKMIVSLSLYCKIGFIDFFFQMYDQLATFKTDFSKQLPVGLKLTLRKIGILLVPSGNKFVCRFFKNKEYISNLYV